MVNKMNRKVAMAVLRQMLESCSDQKEANALDTAIKGMEEGLRCRWHYLTRNPDDLPEVGREILYVFSYPSTGNGRRQSTNTSTYTGPDFFEEHDGIVYKAWKYIESTHF